MAHRGRARQDIATDLGIRRRTVTRWINSYCAGGLNGLSLKKAKGKPSPIPPAPADEVRQWVIEGPAKQGLDRANWTHEELADHLFRVKGIRVGKSALRAFGAKHGIRPYRPTYRFLRGDPAEQAKDKADSAALEKRPTPANSCC